MSFIKTIFPATKRRKTGANTFVQPQPPLSRNGQQDRVTSTTLPSSLGEQTAPVVMESPIFDSFCTSSERELRADMLRMVLIEAEQRVLFDTASIVPVANRVLPSNAQLSACKKFQFLKRRRDIPTISQMLFGAMPTAVGSDSFKIHTISEDQSLLISRVFGIPRISSREMHIASDSLESSDSESQAHYITVRSTDSINGGHGRPGCISSTVPPEAFKRVRNTSLQLDDDSEEIRPFSPPTASRLSRDRRIQMSHKTSLCEQSPSMRWKSRSRLSSCGSQTDEEHVRQVGLGIMLNEAEKGFLFQHIPLVEAEMSRLEARIINAAMNSITFFINVNKAWQDFCESVCKLHNAPRLRHPVWLSLLERDHNESVVIADFCRQLTLLVEKLDTKHTKFFLSNVISTVLMHHMSWVASVAPPLHAPTHHDKNPLVGSIYNDEAPCMPYNVQIAQYLEISGSVGSAHRMAKTVVSGADSDLVTSILQVLSYFIRCSAIHQKDDERCSQLPIAQSFSPCAATTPESIASPPSECPLDGTFSPSKGVEDDAVSSCSLESLPSVLGCRNRDHRALAAGNDVSVSMTQADGLGRSLLAGPSSEYSPHFVLSGLIGTPNHINEAFAKMIDDVRCENTACHRAAAISLSSSMSSSVYDTVQLPDNVIILADTHTWSVQVASNEGWGEVFSPSEAVVSMLEQFCDLYRVGYAPKLLISYLEDSLSDVLSKSLSLVEIRGFLVFISENVVLLLLKKTEIVNPNMATTVKPNMTTELKV
ncbi:hypothetical protein RB195_001374 [Necator americanus]|uniref:UDENN FNIP1/2-type domain-containing protein n=1 Tax=Necator americanus TaxID=51031 RepID=A0ABR1DE84_NECAM